MSGEPRSRQKKASRRQIDRLGVAVTLRNYEEAEDTSYGPKRQQTPDSPKTVQAVPSPKGESLMEKVTGTDADYDMMFLIADDNAVNMKGEERASELASEIDFMDETFVVYSVDKYHDAGVVKVKANTE